MAGALQAGIVNSPQSRKRDRKQTVGRGWLLVIPRRSGMEKGQGTDSGERLAPSHPKEIRYGEGAGD
jgi:hypothetical protein